MQVTVLQENLHKALSFVGKTISTKTQLPILSNILLKTSNGRLILSSTNLETSISYEIGATIAEEGAITVPGRLLTELVASFAKDHVSLAAQKTSLKLTCGRSEATLAGIAAEEFPPLPVPSEKKQAQLDKSTFETALSFVLVAVSSDESRPLLTGVKLDKRAGTMVVVATDGYRLSLKKIQEITGLKEGLVISGRALSEVYRLATEDKAETIDIYFSQDGNQIIFVLPNAQLATRLIEGEYPTYEKIIPTSFTTRAVFTKIDLVRAVKLAVVYAKESANILKLKINKNEATISANSPQIGENQTTLDIKSEGDEVEVALNTRFLLELLSVIPEEDVVFETTGALSPAVFKLTKDDSYLHIIMPVRVQS